MKQLLIENLLKEGIGVNAVCKECKNLYNMFTTPLTPYLISDKSTNPKNRIMFIGKVARGCDIGENITDDYEDVTGFGHNYILESSWAYYSYTKEIVLNYYGDLDKALKHISFTNMVKCNNETTNDTTPYEAKISCIDKNQFVWKEIDIIQPKKIVFYTHSYYDDFIEKFRPSGFERYIDITERSFRVNVGEKTSLFWHRDFYDKNNLHICSFLRVSHPMMKNKEEFVERVGNWLIKIDNI